MIIARFLSATFTLAAPEELRTAIHHASPVHPVRCATLNPEFMVEAGRNTAFRNALAAMTHCTIDGSGLLFFLRLWRTLYGRRIPESRRADWSAALHRYPGADLVEDLLSRYAQGERSFFFLGGEPGGEGTPGQAEQAATALQRRYPRLRLVGTASGGRGISPPHCRRLSGYSLGSLRRAQAGIVD
jgi:UDP-N-acetyl-D-mannosaminuronic acid transferase (WecB/TagA/CpsF family)